MFQHVQRTARFSNIREARRLYAKVPVVRGGHFLLRALDQALRCRDETFGIGMSGDIWRLCPDPQIFPQNITTHHETTSNTLEICYMKKTVSSFSNLEHPSLVFDPELQASDELFMDAKSHFFNPSFKAMSLMWKACWRTCSGNLSRQTDINKQKPKLTSTRSCVGKDPSTKSDPWIK